MFFEGYFVLVVKIAGLVTKSCRIIIFHLCWDTLDNKKNYPETARLNWPMQREVHIFPTSESETGSCWQFIVNVAFAESGSVKGT